MNTGRIDFDGKPLAIWFKTKAGTYSAMSPTLGDFNAPTLEALRQMVLAAEAERLEKALEAFEALKAKRNLFRLG